MRRPASCLLTRRLPPGVPETKNPFGLAARTGLLGAALAVFIKRPQAENQIGAVKILIQS